MAFDAKSTRNTRSWRVKTSRRSPGNDTTHQWQYLSEVHALGGLAFYLIYAEELDRVFVALMPFPIEERQRFDDVIEVVKDENGWWDWLEALEEVGVLAVPPSLEPVHSPGLVAKCNQEWYNLDRR